MRHTTQPLPGYGTVSLEIWNDGTDVQVIGLDAEGRIVLAREGTMSSEPTFEGTGGIEGILPAEQLTFDSHGTLKHEHCATPSCARRIATLAESIVRASNMGAIKGANEHTVMANLCPSTDADDAQAPAALSGGTLCKWMALSAEDLSAIAYMAPERDVLIGATLYELRQAPWAIRPQTR